jgi:hypothetical protein
MPTYKTQKPPFNERLWAALLNATTSKISPETQQKILTPSSIPQGIGSAYKAYGEQAGGRIADMAGGVAKGGSEFISGLMGTPPPQAQPPQPTAPQPTPEAATGTTQPEIDQTSKVDKFIQQHGDAKKRDEQKAKWIQSAVRLGIPLSAAIAGSINPNLLPEAAGLATGSNKGFERQEDFGLEQEKVGISKQAVEYNQGQDLEDRADRLVSAMYEGAVQPPTQEELLDTRQMILDRLKGKTTESKSEGSNLTGMSDSELMAIMNGK